MGYTKGDILSAIKNAGIVGAGGGGFPTHIKFDSSVETLIANGSECEPLLASDKSLMFHKAQLLIDGMKLAMIASGASEGIIGLKKDYPKIIEALEKVLPADKSIRLHLLDNFYPAGDEHVLVYELTGKIIPEGGIPLNVGVVVSNVLSLAQIYHGVHGKPVTERIISVVGEVEAPKVFNVPIGTTYQKLVDLAGGATCDCPVIIDGGPMMGAIVEDIEDGIGKTTSGVIVLPHDHFIVNMKRIDLQRIVKKSKAACCQCFRCTDLCSRNLLGHKIYPHMTMRTIDYNLDAPTEHITSAYLCSQCGICEMVACDAMMLSPKRVYGEYRKLLGQKKVANPHKDNIEVVDPSYINRKIDSKTLMKKLNISSYYRADFEYIDQVEVESVKVPLNKHMGAWAIPDVGLGESVSMGQVIARSPEESLGAICHAPISGTVVSVTDRFMEIR